MVKFVECVQIASVLGDVFASESPRDNDLVALEQMVGCSIRRWMIVFKELK